MKDLEDVYKRQDEAILTLRTATAEFYNYELQVGICFKADGISQVDHKT